MISYGRQFIDKKDISAVVKVLKSKNLTQGPIVEKFENDLKKFMGSKYCCVLSSGTGALHLTGLTLGWNERDYVITTPISFLATSNAILYSGAKPIFVDIDKDTYNISAELVEKMIKNFKKKKNIKALIATDFAGNPCDWKKLKKISRKYNFKLINDNCHALGAKYLNDYKYAQKYADIVTHSYHPVKQITTGEGGALFTNDKKIYLKIKQLRAHGVLRRKKNLPWYYEMTELGYNYRLTDFQSALGISQLKKLKLFLKKRNEISKIYNTGFENNNFIKTPKVFNLNKHAFHLYPILIDFKKIKKTKKMFFNYLKRNNILPQVHYIPIFLQPYYKKKFNININKFPNSKKFYEQEVSLPIYYSLKKNEVLKTISLVNKFVK